MYYENLTVLPMPLKNQARCAWFLSGIFNYILLHKKVKGFYIIFFILKMNVFHFNYIEIIIYYTYCLLHLHFAFAEIIKESIFFSNFTSSMFSSILVS